MFNIFKYIDYAMKAKQGYEAPDELLADTSFGVVEGFFIMSFVIITALGFGSLYLGFGLGYWFFKVIGVLLVIVLVADIILFRFLKATVGKISKHITNTVRDGFQAYQGNLTYNNSIDVEAHDVDGTQNPN